MHQNKLDIKVGSVTNAQRARALLQKKNIKSQIKRIQNHTAGEGCGYIVSVDGSGDRALEIIKNASIRVLGVEES